LPGFCVSLRRPARRPRRGVAGEAEIAELYMLDSYKTEITIVDGDCPAVMSDVSFIQRTTKRVLRFSIANFLRYRDGKLIEFREFVNSFDVVEQALGRELSL